MGSVAQASVGAWVTMLGGGMVAPTLTWGPNLLRLGAAAPEFPLEVGGAAAPGSAPFFTQGILPTPTRLVLFLAGGPGSGVFLVPIPQDILMLFLFSGRGCSVGFGGSGGAEFILGTSSLQGGLPSSSHPQTPPSQ